MLAKRKAEFSFDEEQTILEPSVVREPKLDGRLRAKCLIFILLFAVLAMVTTIRSGTIVSEGYGLVQTKVQAAQLEKDNERLKLEIAQMKSPQRIKQFAVSTLGMVVPEDVYFVARSGQ